MNSYQMVLHRPVETATILGARFSAGTAITHSFVARSAAKLKLALLTTQAISGGSNSTIMCQDIAMTLARPLWAVVSKTTGPGSSNWYTFDRGRSFITIIAPGPRQQGMMVRA